VVKTGRVFQHQIFLVHQPAHMNMVLPTDFEDFLKLLNPNKKASGRHKDLDDPENFL
jgi:hypothetical protein